MFWPTLTHYGWAVSIRTAGQFVALQVDSFHHNGWRYWVRIRTIMNGEFPDSTAKNRWFRMGSKYRAIRRIQHWNSHIGMAKWSHIEGGIRQRYGL